MTKNSYSVRNSSKLAAVGALIQNSKLLRMINCKWQSNYAVKAKQGFDELFEEESCC